MNLHCEWLLLPVLSQELEENLLLGEDKRCLHCFTLSPATMLLKRIQLSDPRWTLSAFFMDSYTSNIMSIQELSPPVRNAHMKRASESLAKVLLSPWTFWTRFIPSMMQLTVAASLLLMIHFFQLSGQFGLDCLFQRAITFARLPWQWSKWMGQHWFHVPLPACCNEYHMAKQVSLLVLNFWEGLQFIKICCNFNYYLCEYLTEKRMLTDNNLVRIDLKHYHLFQQKNR